MSTLETYNDIAHRKMLTGMFHDRISTENAFNELFEKGYAHQDVNIVMTEDTCKKHFTYNDEIGDMHSKPIGYSSVIGGAIGAIAGVVASIAASLVVPGLSLILAGPLAAGFASAGGLTGTIIGALVGAGIPEVKAKEYEDGIKKGNIFLCLHSSNEEDANYFNSKWKQQVDSENESKLN